MAKKKTFSKLKNHLKSTELDEKLSMLDEDMPRNNTAFVFQGDPSNPQGNSFETITDGETDETDYNIGENPTNSTEARDTTGLFNAGGVHADGKYVKTEEPPGDTSYVLGPMAAMYYTWSYPWTMVGYIRESDRRMVNLGRIDGKLSDWDGSSGSGGSGTGTFYSYGQLTTEQALWFRDIKKANGNTNDPATYSYRAFYPGPPSATPDAYGRYPCILTGVSKKEPREVPDATPLDKQAGDNFSAQNARNKRGIGVGGEEGEYEKGDGDDNIADKITKFLKNVNNVLDKVTNNPVTNLLDNILPSKIIADTITDTIFGVDDASSYNGQLGLQLFNNVLTGNNAKIKLTEKGKKNMFDSINPDLLGDALQIRPPSDTSHDNAIRPNGKKENVLTKGWGDQGGSEFSFDPKTNLLTIHSNKMLRKMDGDKVNRNGKIVEFEDIPNPTNEQIKKVIPEKTLKNFFELTTNVPGVKAGYDKDTAVDMMMDGFPNIIKSIYNFAVEGTASNAVNIRNQLLKNNLTKETQSEKEGEGFGGHTFSQESLNINKLKPEIKKVILDKVNKQESVSLERKREIFGNLTKPVILPETKQKTYNVSPGQRYKNKNKKSKETNFQDMDKLFNKNIGGPQPFKPQERTSWTKDFINHNVIQSQEKMNGVLELIGNGKHAFGHAMNDYKKMGAKELEQYWGKNPNMYSFLFNGKKYNVTRKEHIEGDSIVFMEDQHGVKSNMLQSKINEILQEENEKWINEAYFKSHPVIPKKEESTYELIKRRFLENKKIAPEFPAESPPKMINGFHPEYGKKANRYKKLDPASANSMPPTGDPEIDAVVNKQKTINKIKRMAKNK